MPTRRTSALARPQQDVVLASLVPAVRRQMPVMFVADRASDIREAVAFAEEMKLKPIIVGGRDALAGRDAAEAEGRAGAAERRHGAAVARGRPVRRQLLGAGTPGGGGRAFAITSGDQGAETRNLPYMAGMAAAFGLSKSDALKSVTLWPAQILGVADRLGSLEVGKIANLVVVDGDLLEARTNTKYLFIDGRMVPLESKHTDLNERFKDRP